MRVAPVTIVTDKGLTFAELSPGRLAIGHRPPVRAMSAMAGKGITHIATVLAEHEDPHTIGEAARRAGMAWIWLPLGSTKSLPSVSNAKIRTAIEDMATALQADACIYLHCSAGLHRTGMMAAALLFRLGHDAECVRATLAGLRSLTARDMGEQRFAWAAAFARESRPFE
jgi:hypothetical protein